MSDVNDNRWNQSEGSGTNISDVDSRDENTGDPADLPVEDPVEESGSDPVIEVPVEDPVEESGSGPVIEVEDIEEKKTEEKIGVNGKKVMNPVLEWVIIIAIAVAAALFINFVIIINSVVPSGSMETTIMTGSRMMGLRVTYWFNDPERGDIIVFKYPDDPSENFVKRVIGLPGETVEIIGGVTYIDGEKLDEPYLKETPLPRDFGPFEVPDECYFVMGDNRNNSNDARFWKNKYVPRSSVLGKAMFVYWPISRIGALK